MRRRPRAGGVNESIGLPAGLAPHKSDSLWGYELGVKTAWLDHRLVVNANVFEIDWQNLQVPAESNNVVSLPEER